MNVFDPFYHKNTHLIWCRGEYNCIYVIKRDDLMTNYSVNNDKLVKRLGDDISKEIPNIHDADIQMRHNNCWVQNATNI